MKKLIYVAIAAAVIWFAVSVLSVDYEAGTYTQSTYESTFLDYRFNKPVGCEFFSTEEIAEQMSINVSKFAGDEEALKKEMAKKRMIIDMAAYTNSGANVMVAINKTPTFGQSLSGLAEMAIEELPGYTDGSSVASDEYTMTEIMGKSCVLIGLDTAAHGMNLNQDMYIFKEDLYYGYVVISYFDGYEHDGNSLKAALNPLL